ncbi:phosphate-starvation-inducible PsiE family protein [Thiohalophilus sp.]|uniref:phosphate-starvation-inducible protein PsiE n=1 Tax=Thiohalophilus sp. TaxID=3028392 RepID=UPI002ACE5624|nr:phosphate-starvation-inducible PsiE family protein [Thiohalophilus sp.]MDZ7805453.1 phosphate-starvation-inducible PsiE family protein [Thiohalophilus sp.]
MELRGIKLKLGESLDLLQALGLVLIAVATVIAFGIEIGVMVENRAVTLADLLLMFIYLEVLAMIGIYLKSGKLPIRIPLYIAIIALARYLVLDMKAMEDWRMLAVAGSALIIAVTILVIRYGHTRYPYDSDTGG